MPAIRRPWFRQGLRSVRRWFLARQLPKPLARMLGHLHRTAYRRLVVPSLTRGTAFNGVVELRRDPRDANWSRRMLGEALTVRFTEPRQGGYLNHLYNYAGGAQRFEPPFVAVLDRGLLHVPTGGMATANRMIVSDSCKGHLEWLLKTVPSPVPARARPGTHTTLLVRLNSNYYHWLMDCLPRLWVLARAGLQDPVTLLLPDTLAPFQRTTLAWCLPPGIEVVFTDDSWVQADSLVFASGILEPMTGYLPQEYLEYLRQRAFAHAGEPPIRRDRRLYLSRTRPGQPRRILNEGDVIERLSKHGFEVCLPEKLSMEEQVQLFRSASTIVGSRGAALTNMLFGTNLKVLELTSPAPRATAVYFSLAAALGHDYYYSFARRRVGVDIDVDLDALERVVVRMEQAPPRGEERDGTK